MVSRSCRPGRPDGPCRGRALTIALIALTGWGDEWASEGEPPILYRHTGCGDGAVHAVAACDSCGAVPDDEVAVEIGPGMPASIWRRVGEALGRATDT